MSTPGSCCAATSAYRGKPLKPRLFALLAGSLGSAKMANMLWLNWSGGGNLPPSLGIARVLTERGHHVTFAGRPEMVPRVKAAGFRAIEITQAYAQVDRYPQGLPLTRPACYLTSPAVEEEV